MDIIKFDKLHINIKRIKNGYRQMFNPHNSNYRELWEIYNEVYCDLYKKGIKIPREMEYPLYEENIYSNKSSYRNYKNSNREFNKMMKETIEIIEREVL